LDLSTNAAYDELKDFNEIAARGLELADDFKDVAKFASWIQDFAA